MTTQTQSLSLLTPDSSLRGYLARVRNFPMLEFEDEQALGHAWRDNQDVKAAHKLVTSHLRLVVKVAFSFRRYGLPISDIISEGNVGLMEAVKKFDPVKGFRLSTYAIWWIRASIQEYILKSWSLVKIGTTTRQKMLFFNLGRTRRRIAELNADASMDTQNNLIASELGVDVSDVTSMSMRMSGDLSLNKPIGDEGYVEWLDTIADSGEDQESSLVRSDEYDYRKTLVMKAMSSLNEREREILVARRLGEETVTLNKLSERFKVSRERIRQIEESAMKKLTALVTDMQDVSPAAVAS